MIICLRNRMIMIRTSSIDLLNLDLVVCADSHLEKQTWPAASYHEPYSYSYDYSYMTMIRTSSSINLLNLDLVAPIG